MNALSKAIQCVAMRPCQADDESFLFKVYASTREDEMALVAWTQQQKEAFLQMQFNAQHHFYVANYPGAQFLVILLDDQSIGRLYIYRNMNAILIIDIALLPEYRNAGIGTSLIRDLQEEARKSGLLIRLHVEPFNPAMSLYKKLGFIKTGEISFYHEMTWQPEVVNHV